MVIFLHDVYTYLDCVFIEMGNPYNDRPSLYKVLVIAD